MWIRPNAKNVSENVFTIRTFHAVFHVTIPLVAGGNMLLIEPRVERAQIGILYRAAMIRSGGLVLTATEKLSRTKKEKPYARAIVRTAKFGPKKAVKIVMIRQSSFIPFRDNHAETNARASDSRN